MKNLWCWLFGHAFEEHIDVTGPSFPLSSGVRLVNRVELCKRCPERREAGIVALDAGGKLFAGKITRASLRDTEAP